VPQDDRPDVCQEVFRAVHRHIGDFQRQRSGSFRTWLRSIVRSKAADHFARHSGNASAVGGSAAYSQLLEVPEEQETSQSTALPPNEKAIVSRQAMAIVQAEFEQTTWRAAWCTIIDGRSAPEVAKELAMTPEAVRQAKSRVLRRLRTELKDLFD
jgi:RNA polymerase sigma-70 factor (ECF subfamily)